MWDIMTEMALKEGLIDIFIQVRGVVMNHRCGPRSVTHEGILASNEFAITSTNRNFKGRTSPKKLKCIWHLLCPSINKNFKNIFVLFFLKF